MCVNVAFNKKIWVNNIGQRLAGTGIFVSRIKNDYLENDYLAAYDEPFKLHICRLHFESRHKEKSWEKIPINFNVAVHAGPFDRHYKDDEDVSIYRKVIMEDSSIGRGYWKSTRKEKFRILPTFKIGSIQQFVSEDGEFLYLNVDDPCDDYRHLIDSCTRGRWAYVLLPSSERSFSIDNVKEGESISLGEWRKDGFGCHLSYAIPVGAPIKLTGEGFHCINISLTDGYEEGYLGVEIPWGTKYALWIRCSDTDIHSGFMILYLQWFEWGKVFCNPLLVSLFAAPHDFPIKYGSEPTYYETGTELKDAIELAETINKNGGFPGTVPTYLASLAREEKQKSQPIS